MSLQGKKLLHVSVLVRDLEQSLKFYRDLLGLAVKNNRPELGYPGAWLAVGEAEIHLMQLPNPDPLEGRPSHGGRDRHFALQIDDFAGFRAKLNALGVRYTVSQSGRPALFLRDPDGNAVEIIGTN